MTLLALRLLLHSKLRSFSAIAGISMAFFLASAQIGLLVGWCNTCTAIIRHANVDVWIMAPQTPAFDYGTPIPRQRIYQTRSVPGVAWAEGMVMTWMFWQLPNGRQQNVEMVGVDDSLAGCPWKMVDGDLQSVLEPDAIIVDTLFKDRLGVRAVGDEVEIQGRRGVIRGICAEVRTLTAAPFVFTSLDTAIRCDPRYSSEQVTYVLARCQDGVEPQVVAQQIAKAVPSVDVATTDQFVVMTIRYWMLETGLGITVVLTAILGLVVGGVIVSQTLFAITHEHLKEYATLLAIGFGRGALVRMVCGQAVILGLGGVFIGYGLFVQAMQASADTPIPLETTPALRVGLVALFLLGCIIASVFSVRSLFHIDPVSVFHN